MGKLLKKEDLNKFLYKIKTKHELIAPVKSDAVRFETVKFISQIILNKLPEFSPKKYFIPRKDEMFKFKDSKIIVSGKVPKRVIFGIRLCDVNAIFALDKLFLGKNIDSSYNERRDKTILIAIKCEKEKEKNCFCTSMNLKNHADLYFHDLGDSYHIEVKSDKGMRLVSRLKNNEHKTTPILTKKRLEKRDISPYIDNKEWEIISKKCISCGICTNICPTCLCYREKDEGRISSETGKRVRRWVSCQHDDFWVGEEKENLNLEKNDKLKHRVYHKLHYFKKNYGEEFCTGCGRCITNCSAQIDFVKAINKM